MKNQAFRLTEDVQGVFGWLRDLKVVSMDTETTRLVPFHPPIQRAKSRSTRPRASFRDDQQAEHFERQRRDVEHD